MKTQNPRVAAHRKLQEIKQWLGWAEATWSQSPSLRFYADEPGGEERWHVQPRLRADIRPDEYPEHRAEAWAELANWARAVARQAAELEHFAREQQEKVSS